MKNNKQTRNIRLIPDNLSDYFAKNICSALSWLADAFFQKRYGHRAVMLETLGMVGGMLIHLKCLHKQCSDNGWIKILLDEAENEQMDLMTFIEIAKPNWLERLLIAVTQIIFFTAFLVLYLISPKSTHRLVGYF